MHFNSFHFNELGLKLDRFVANGPLQWRPATWEPYHDSAPSSHTVTKWVIWPLECQELILHSWEGKSDEGWQIANWHWLAALPPQSFRRSDPISILVGVHQHSDEFPLVVLLFNSGPAFLPRGEMSFWVSRQTLLPLIRQFSRKIKCVQNTAIKKLFALGRSSEKFPLLLLSPTARRTFLSRYFCKFDIYKRASEISNAVLMRSRGLKGRACNGDRSWGYTTNQDAHFEEEVNKVPYLFMRGSVFFSDKFSFGKTFYVETFFLSLVGNKGLNQSTNLLGVNPLKQKTVPVSC